MVKRVPGRPLAQIVIAMAVLLTVPLLVLATFITSRWVHSEQNRLRDHTRKLVDYALSEADRFAAEKIAAIQVLASSPSLASGDFEGFHRQVHDLRQTRDVHVVLRDMFGQQLVNTRAAWGDALPRVKGLETDVLVISTGKPQISNLFIGDITKNHIIAATVPVWSGGKIKYLLSAALDPPSVARVFKDAGLAEPYSGTIADRNGVIIGRSDLSERWVGSPFLASKRSRSPVEYGPA